MNQIMNAIVSSVCPVEKGKREAFKKNVRKRQLGPRDLHSTADNWQTFD